MRSLGGLLVLGAVALALLPNALGGQSTLRLSRPSGEVGSDFDGSWMDLHEQAARNRRIIREWLDLRVALTLLDPRVFRADFNLRPLIGQKRWGGGFDSPDGGIEQLDGGGQVSILSGAPVSVRAWGQWLTDVNRGAFGSRTEYGFGEWGAEARSRSWFFPARFYFDQRSRDFLSVAPSGFGFREKYDTRTARMTLESSKTFALAERVSRNDRVNGEDFIHDRAEANHRLHWGKGSSLNSQFRYFRRSGLRESVSRSWSERALIQHTQAVSSTLFLGRAEGKTSGVSTLGSSAEYRLRYRPARTVEIAVEALGRDRRYGAGSSSYLRAQPRLSLSLPIRRNLQLRALLEGGYEWHDQKRGEEVWLAVVGEQHILGADLSFRLDEAFIDRQSLVLRSRDGEVLYQEGFDFRIVESGPNLEIFVLPGGRLGEGDIVLADYRFQALPGASAEAWVARYDVSLRLGGRGTGLSLFYRRSLQDAVGPIPSGVISTLLNYDNMEMGAEVELGSRWLRLNLAGEYGWRSSDLFEYTSKGARAGLRFLLAGGLEGTLTAMASRRTGDEIRFDVIQGLGRLIWTPHPNFRIGGDVALYEWEEIPIRRERFLGGGINTRVQVGRTVLEARVDRNDWENHLLRRRSEDRVVIRLVRTF